MTTDATDVRKDRQCEEGCLPNQHSSLFPGCLLDTNRSSPERREGTCTCFLSGPWQVGRDPRTIVPATCLHPYTIHMEQQAVVNSQIAIRSHCPFVHAEHQPRLCLCYSVGNSVSCHLRPLWIGLDLNPCTHPGNPRGCWKFSHCTVWEQPDTQVMCLRRQMSSSEHVLISSWRRETKNPSHWGPCRCRHCQNHTCIRLQRGSHKQETLLRFQANWSNFKM